MAVRALKGKLKTSKSLPQVLSSCTLCNLTTGTEIGTRYRYIDDTPLVPMTEAGKANGTNAASSASGAKTRSRSNNEYVLYSYGAPAAVNSDDGTSYFGTDILGSVRNVTDKYGAVQSSYDYDAFGSPYLGNLDNGMSFGYTGKAYDASTGLYDYGFRDYSPVSARFTTIDPIRDGSNWFSYVVNDPVNYVDPFGLNTTDSTSQTQHAIQESSPGLKALTFVKYLVSGAMSLAGLVTGNPLLVAGAVIISQAPTGRIVNQTTMDIAFKGESESPLGKAYFGQGTITYTKVDEIVTPTQTFKTFTLSDVKISYDKNGNIVMKPTLGTKVVNAFVNAGKTLLRGSELNKEGGVISNLVGHPITTEPYGIYNNEILLSPSGNTFAPELSKTLKKWNDPENIYYNPGYIQEKNYVEQ